MLYKQMRKLLLEQHPLTDFFIFILCSNKKKQP
nr:MAG TPA: hypothetical protein [Caudoviricetes sp.]